MEFTHSLILRYQISLLPVSQSHFKEFNYISSIKKLIGVLKKWIEFFDKSLSQAWTTMHNVCIFNEAHLCVMKNIKWHKVYIVGLVHQELSKNVIHFLYLDYLPNIII